MKFTMTERGGRRAVTWEDGSLSGDAVVVALVEGEAAAREGSAVSFPTMDATFHNHLTSPLSFMLLAMDVLGPDAIATGDVPQFPAVPDGAVA